MTDILTRIHSMKEELEQLEEAVLEQLDKVSEAEPQEDAPAAEAEETTPEAEETASAVEEAEAPAVVEEAAPAVDEVEAPAVVEEAAPAVDEVETAPEEEIPVEETVFDFAEEEDMPDFGEETVSEVPAAEPEAAAEEKRPDVEQAVIDDELEVLPIGEALAPAKDAVMDKMAAKESWRTDIPGAKVSDVRSAISLNDRVLFINTLFHEDPLAFQNALSQLNSMPTFDEGARFILDRHPEWNTESDVVYRFMMAVRRKLR